MAAKTADGNAHIGDVSLSMVSRRNFFSQLGQVLAANVTDAFECVRVAASRDSDEKPESQSWLRPPGALPEDEFLKRCTQSTDCQEACPYDSIRRLGPEFGVAAGTPALIPTESPCYLCEDMPCISACVPRALIPTARTDVRMGTALMDTSRCYVAAGQPCDYCLDRCPLGSDAIALGSTELPVINKVGCTGCGVCAYLCPGDAISIEPANDKE